MERPFLPGYLWYGCLVIAGRAAAQVKLCRVWVGPDGHFHKRRKPTAWLWVWPLNLALRALGIRLEVLSARDWLERERAILYGILGRKVAVETGNVLVTPRLPGQCLWRFTRQQQQNRTALWPAIESAARALKTLHQAGATHSDAALHNAFYSAETGEVFWLDFETRYRRTYPQEWCCAHDLAAFLASATKALPKDAIDGLVDAVARGYGDLTTLARAGKLLQLVPVILIVETPWNLENLEQLRQRLRPEALGAAEENTTP